METGMEGVYSRGYESKLLEGDTLSGHTTLLAGVEEGLDECFFDIQDRKVFRKYSSKQQEKENCGYSNNVQEKEDLCRWSNNQKYEGIDKSQNKPHVISASDEVLSGPHPTPSRAKYGFSLYLGSTGGFMAYIIWGLVPKLETGGLELALPSRYWAIALPIWVLVTIAVVAFLFYPAINVIMVPDPSSPLTISDSYSKPMPEGEPKRIPHLYDMDPALVSKLLYLQPEE